MVMDLTLYGITSKAIVLLNRLANLGINSHKQWLESFKKCSKSANFY